MKLLVEFVLLTFFFLSPAYASSLSLKQTVAKYLDEQNVSGSIQVMQGRKKILDYKFRSSTESDPKISSNLFPVGSITKEFTAAAILILAQKGQVDLKSPIGKYLPELPKAWASQVTVHHLLTHSSGISNYLDEPGFSGFYESPHSSGELLEFFSKLHSTFVAGNHYEYSGSGYNLLGLILERVLKRNYGDIIQSLIFRKAGMDQSQCPHSEMLSTFRKKVPVVRGHVRSKDKWIVSDDINLSTAFAEASCLSTTGDLNKWNQALFSHQILSPEYLNLMIAPKLDTKRKGIRMGYGVFVETLVGPEVRYFHTGSINGFQSSISYFKVSRLSVAILSNTMDWNAEPLVKLVYSLHRKPQ